MTESSFPTWIIVQRHGMVPDKKGPFCETQRVEEFLRELYSLYPGCICIVVNDLGAAGWYPDHGYEWLDIYGDNRRRHPREDEQGNKPVGYLRPSGLELLKTGGAHLYARRDWQANIPVYAYPAPQDHVMADAASDLNAAMETYVARVKANGGYLPAIATLLRIKADELADRYPDDANGGATTEGSDR